MTEVNDPQCVAVSTPTYEGPCRRKRDAWAEKVERTLGEHQTKLDEHDLRFASGSTTMQGLRDDLNTNTTMTKAVKSDTAELVDILQSAKGAMRVLNMIAALAKPLGAIITLVVAVLGFLHLLKTGTGVPK